MRVGRGELAGGLDHHAAAVAGIVEIVEKRFEDQRDLNPAAFSDHL